MKKVVSIIVVMFITGIIFANQADFFNTLIEKETATFEDCVKSFCYMSEIEVTGDFDMDVDNLKAVIPDFPRKYSASKPLIIGDFALLAMQFLKIDGGLFYRVTSVGRYASRELTFINFLPANTSEYEKLSGIELMQLLRRVDEYDK